MTSFRPLTRIHLLLTSSIAEHRECASWFPTSDEDSSTPDLYALLFIGGMLLVSDL